MAGDLSADLYKILAIMIKATVSAGLVLLSMFLISMLVKVLYGDEAEVTAKIIVVLSDIAAISVFVISTILDMKRDFFSNNKE